MIINSVRVCNFRCIRDETLKCEGLTVLVGANGCGKSSFLRAIELFYTLHVRVTEEDFYNKNVEQPISITIVFNSLTQEELELYKSYLDGTTLTVEKNIIFPGGRGNERYFGSKMQNPDFQEVRNVTAALNKRDTYSRLREQYADLPTVGRADDIEPALLEWEQKHPEFLQRIQDSGQFFGFREVGNAKLERFTRFIPVPAVRDASEDAMEGRTSYLTDLIDLVVRQVLQQKPELEKFKKDTQEAYKELMDVKNLPELPKLADDLTNTLQTYVPEAQLSLDWKIDEFNIPMPSAFATLIEDDFKGDVSKKGHGLQRAFILALLQHLTIVRGVSEVQTYEEVTDSTQETIEEQRNIVPNLVIAIEEPELYQHPNRQRHLAQIFAQLTESGLDSGERLQIIYSTHSPLFIGIDRSDKIRLLQKEKLLSNSPKETRITLVKMDHIAQKLAEVMGASEGTITESSLRARLKNLMTPMVNEGFFASVVALVEGESDQSAIQEVARQIGVDFVETGISLIPVRGKPNLAYPILIFSELGIPVYVVFDCDAKTDDKHSELVMKLCGCPDEQLPRTTVKENIACFETDLEALLRGEIGEELYDQLLEHYTNEFGYSTKRGERNPLVISKIIEEVYKRGNNIETLENIVNCIVKLKK